MVMGPISCIFADGMQLAWGPCQAIGSAVPYSEGSDELFAGYVTFFSPEGVAYHECTPSGQMINEEYYTKVSQLMDAVRRK